MQPVTSAHEPVPDGVARERALFHAGQGRAADPRRGDIDAIRHGYLASIAFMDRQIGRIFAELERRGLAHNTLVLFVSDHGDMIGDLELITKGAYFYDPCTRVPMILRLPDGELAGHRVRDLVQPHDLAATLLRAAGMAPAAVTALMPQSMDLAALARAGYRLRGAPRPCHYPVPQRRHRPGPAVLGSADPCLHVPRRALQAHPVPGSRGA